MSSNIATELTLQLPDSAVRHFSKMFADLDKNKKELNFAEYGIGVTTLEEVFLNVDIEY